MQDRSDSRGLEVGPPGIWVRFQCQPHSGFVLHRFFGFGSELSCNSHPQARRTFQYASGHKSTAPIIRRVLELYNLQNYVDDSLRHSTGRTVFADFQKVVLAQSAHQLLHNGCLF